MTVMLQGWARLDDPGHAPMQGQEKSSFTPATGWSWARRLSVEDERFVCNSIINTPSTTTWDNL